MSEFVPISVPNISGREWEYVKDCLDTAWVSSVGAYVTRFEGMVAEQMGAQHAVATTSGTAALHLALLIAGVREGAEVVLPSLTFVASANAVRYAGAWPVIVDSDPELFQIDTASLRRFLEEDCVRGSAGLVNRATGRIVQAILPVHVLGHPFDVDEVSRIASEFELTVVEDAAEAIGTRYKGRAVGSGSRLACVSFNGNKILTTGGGGMLITNDDALAKRARYLSTQAKDDEIEYVHGEVGFNYRLTNVQAAIGCAQLEQLDQFVLRKREIAARYEQELAKVPGLHPMAEAAWADSTFWMYTVRLDRCERVIEPMAMILALADRGIQARPLWQPMHRSRAHRGSHHSPCPGADRAHDEAVSLPCSTNLTDAQQTRVIEAVKEVARS